MPELPEINAYIEGLERVILGEPLERIRVRSPSLLRTWDPPLSAAEGMRVTGLRRIGKRVVWQMENELTLKRALTDPRVFSGIGNAHSDEILLFAKLSPLQLSRNLSDAEVKRLYEVTRSSLTEWLARLRVEFADDFPQKITAFHPAMAAHGKYGEPCPVCGSLIQRGVSCCGEV